MSPHSFIDSVTTQSPNQTRRLSALDVWETARTLGYPAALWRLPNQPDKHLVVQFDPVLPRVAADLEELPAGFLISPFANFADVTPADGTGAPARTLFLRSDLRARFTADGETDLTMGTGEAADRFGETLRNQSRLAQANQPATLPPPITVLPDPNARERYVRNVVRAVEAMQRGEFRKVVLSRTKRVEFADAPNAVDLFNRLCVTYPTAFVSAVYLPEYGQIWISATPEQLVSVDADGVFRTLSLAGTQPALEPDGQPKRPSEAMWSQKEIEEQALVSRYIIECFKKIRLREYLEEGPKTIVAGNLMHLSTRFTVDTQAVRYPQLGTVMLRLLHPTSAVCGMPRDRAFAYIEQHEAEDREFYAGFLGPVNMNANQTGPSGDLFVHIRCMKLEGKLATLYAGAGLTEDSVPEREWLETEMKCQTLLNCLVV